MDCRLAKSSMWAMRCMNEAQLHHQNCFITLTYNNEKLPKFGTLYKPDLQNFFKRLRKERGSFRYYACGEYGETTDRAHYHACLFGIDFKDKVQFRRTGDHWLYLSKELTRIWGNGNTSVGELTYETAAYTARYVTKKLSKGQQRYVRVDEDTGEIIPLQQPFAIMSNGGGRKTAGAPARGAIGKQWFAKYHGDIYNADKDFLMMRGKRVRPPRYYDNLYDVVNPLHMEQIKQKRQIERQGESSTEQRARDTITRARLSKKTQL